MSERGKFDWFTGEELHKPIYIYEQGQIKTNLRSWCLMLLIKAYLKISQLTKSKLVTLSLSTNCQLQIS